MRFRIWRFLSLAAALAVGFVHGGGARAAADDKVEVCHKGNTIEVAAAAVPAHLAHGDFVGSCEAPPPGPKDL